MPRQPEGKLVRKIQDRIEQRGGRPFKIQGADESFQEIGIPDLLVCYHGIFLGLEVKMPGEKPSPIQRQVLKSIEAAGGVARVVCSVEEVDEILDQALSPVTLAWIAGFFDGEGSICLPQRGGIQISLTQKNPAPLLEVQSLLSMGNLFDGRHTTNNLGRQRGCRLTIRHKADARRFLTVVGPYLRLPHRRSKVEEACDYLGISVPEYIFPELREHQLPERKSRGN